MDNSDIDFLAPKSGALGWIDTFAIPAKAKNVEAAYKWINFMLKAENAALFTNTEKYGTESKDAGQFLDEAIRANFSRSFTQADIDAGLITYDHDGSQTSSDAFAFTVDDGAGATTSDSFSWTVTNVNDAPTAANSTVTTTEDTAYTFSAADFNFSDVDGDSLASVEITSLESLGALQLSGVDVTLNQLISRADIDAGNLTFTPAADANGAGYDSFAFTVNDGTTDSLSSYTMTVDVTAVNDAPVAVGDGYSTDEDTVLSVAAQIGRASCRERV